MNLNAEASQFDITKLEEQRAFQYYKETLLPEDVKSFNMEIIYRSHALNQNDVKETTVKEVIDNMRKIYHGHARGIIGIGTEIQYRSIIAKDPNYGEIVFILDMSREKVGMVTLRHWHTFATRAVKTELKEGIEPLPVGWGLISKRDEEAAFQVIKNKWVPEFVKRWNQNHMIHKITEEGVLKTLRKVRHDSLEHPEDFDKWPRSDIIHYQSPLPKPHQYVTFMTHRWIRPSNRETQKWPDGTLTAGMFVGTAFFEAPVYDS